MADFKQMYLTMFQAVDNAIDILLQAQLTCEELYLSSPEPEIVLLNTADPKGSSAPEEAGTTQP